MSSKVIATQPVEGDALELAETIKTMLETQMLGKSIVYFEVEGEGTINRLAIEEQTLTDGSIVHNMIAYAD